MVDPTSTDVPGRNRTRPAPLHASTTSGSGVGARVERIGTGPARTRGDVPGRPRDSRAACNDDATFAGSIPEIYDRHLVPLIFESYAADLAARVCAAPGGRVLELAAGTGVATRALARTLPPGVSIVASDVNQPMLDHAMSLGTCRPVEWRLADAMRLPFADGTFDVVACQFGVMFFPDRQAAFAEVRRVLSPGGRFLFSAWDRIEENQFAEVVDAALEEVFPDDPPRFLRRTPHGYCDEAIIARDLREAGFEGPPGIETIPARSRAVSCRIPAIAYCQGTPLRNEIEARDATRLAAATDAAEEAIAGRFGRADVDGKIQARVVTTSR